VIFKALYLPFYDKTSYKWKSKSSVDLKVFFIKEYEGKQEYSLYASGTTGIYPYEVFCGDYDYPHQGVITVSSSLINERFGRNRIPEESIVEFEYGNNDLVPLKIRRDKVKPNFVIIATQIWEQMVEPLTQETLLSLTENLIDSSEPDSYNYAIVNFYLALTYDPTIFNTLNEYLFSSTIPQMFGEEAIRSVGEDENPSDLNKILASFFTTCSM
jgi:hypothetical protein